MTLREVWSTRVCGDIAQEHKAVVHLAVAGQWGTRQQSAWVCIAGLGVTMRNNHSD